MEALVNGQKTLQSRSANYWLIVVVYFIKYLKAPVRFRTNRRAPAHSRALRLNEKVKQRSKFNEDPTCSYVARETGKELQGRRFIGDEKASKAEGWQAFSFETGQF